MYPMIYDEFQQKAIDHIRANHSVIVSAPTGAGKTVIAEYVITDCLKKNKNVIYTAPIKALSNQKYRDFTKGYGDAIGILTGDVTINPAAPVLIMTTEIFRNKVLEQRRNLDIYSWIIFDEIHYLDDYERGTVWEESLVFLPQHMNVLALSATIPNIEEFADWIESIHKKTIKRVIEEKRPVPLHFYYQCQGKIIDRLQEVKRLGYGSGARFSHYRGRKYGRPMRLKPNRPAKLIRHLYHNGRLPCIYFSFARRRCEYLAQEMAEFDFLDSNERYKIKTLYGSLCERFGLRHEKSAIQLGELVERGIAYHHAGMLPTLKEVVECLFTSRMIKVIFTTETFSLGINMPARTVIFDELRKYQGRYYGALKTRDFYQMAGRAGRRGIDNEGFVYSRVNPHFISYEELHKIIFGRPEKVRSRFNASYATTLNLYDQYGEKLTDIYPLSFHYYQEKEKRREKALKLMQSKVVLLKECGYIDDGGLTHKGNFGRRIYGYELPLAELYDENFLEYLSESELGALALALVFEPRKGLLRPKLNKRMRYIRHETEMIVKRIHELEKRHDIAPLSKNYCFHLTPCMEAWMRQERFDKILLYTDSDEGEIIRYFRMAIQVLREILDTPAASLLKEKVTKAIELINRDVIDAEKQLRR